MGFNSGFKGLMFYLSEIITERHSWFIRIPVT